MDGHLAQAYSDELEIDASGTDESIVIDLTGVPRLNIFVRAQYLDGTSAVTGISIALAYGMQEAGVADGIFIYAGATDLVPAGLLPDVTANAGSGLIQGIGQFDPFAVANKGLSRALKLIITNLDASKKVYIDCYADQG